MWRAVDYEGEALNALVQSRQNKLAALELMRKILKSQGFDPVAIVTDKLPSYRAALSDPDMKARHITGGRLNNQSGNLHLPIRQPEGHTQRFNLAGSTLRFLSTYTAICSTFNIQRHLISNRTLRQFRAEAMNRWDIGTVAA